MTLSNILKACLNYKILLGIILGIAIIYLLAPRYVSFLWIFLVLICPVSMVLMMAGMQHTNNQKKDIDKDRKE